MHLVINSVIFLLAAPAAAAPFYGLARAKDGDSLIVGTREVRLFGIDAPEFDQQCKRGRQNYSCGSEAADKLSALVTGKEIRCKAVGVDQHQRTLARCTVGGIEINRVMVSSGMAVAYRRYSTDYVSAEATAKLNKRGIWAGSIEMPSDYRHDEPQVVRSTGRSSRTRRVRVSTAPAQTSSGCSIKGNQGSNGWIYHVPGMPFYERTKAEQMFCSEGEAQAAGYRRATVR